MSNTSKLRESLQNDRVALEQQIANFRHELVRIEGALAVLDILDKQAVQETTTILDAMEVMEVVSDAQTASDGAAEGEAEIQANS